MEYLQDLPELPLREEYVLMSRYHGKHRHRFSAIGHTNNVNNPDKPRLWCFNAVYLWATVVEGGIARRVPVVPDQHEDAYRRGFAYFNSFGYYEPDLTPYPLPDDLWLWLFFEARVIGGPKRGYYLVDPAEGHVARYMAYGDWPIAERPEPYRETGLPVNPVDVENYENFMAARANAFT